MSHFLVTILISASIIGSVFGADQTPATKNDTKPAIRSCYTCTSVLHPGCADSYEGSDKFPHEKVLKVNYSSLCAEKNNTPYTPPGQTPPKAVGCRKILQEVEGKTRVVRECAYTMPDEGDEVNGLKRTGNQGVRLFYYQCAKDYCNKVDKIRIENSIFVFFAIILPTIFAWQW